MRAGDVVVDGAEELRVVRSAAEGDGFHLELILAPGAEGPPSHCHEEPESFEVLEGEMVFSIDGVDRRFAAGEQWVIPPGCVHTFRNASKTKPARALGIHGGRFERLVDQLAAGEPRFLRLCLYASHVDPRASFMINPIVRATMSTLALVAKLRGVRIAQPTGDYGADAR